MVFVVAVVVMVVVVMVVVVVVVVVVNCAGSISCVGVVSVVVTAFVKHEYSNHINHPYISFHHHNQHIQRLVYCGFEPVCRLLVLVLTW